MRRNRRVEGAITMVCLSKGQTDACRNENETVVDGKQLEWGEVCQSHKQGTKYLI